MFIFSKVFFRFSFVYLKFLIPLINNLKFLIRLSKVLNICNSFSFVFEHSISDELKFSQTFIINPEDRERIFSSGDEESVLFFNWFQMILWHKGQEYLLLLYKAAFVVKACTYVKSL